jgi:uncharacterized membrane protein (Fun14 family)
MAVLSADPDTRAQWRELGRSISAGLGWLLFAAGWTLAKTARTVATVVGAVLFAAGWLAGSVAWPALLWCARAVRLGWQEGRKPGGLTLGPS